jgi:uncharacterized protein
MINKKEERTFGMLCHILAFVAFVGIPFGNIVGPLVMWFIKKEESEFVDICGRESLNFQISVTIYAFAASILSFIFIGIPILIAIAIGNIILVIMAGMKANEGEVYRYPLCMRFF